MINPEEFAALGRDAKREREVASHLRAIPKEERWHFIKSALDADKKSNLPMALILACRVSLDKSHLVELLEISLERADPSSMNSYLKAVVPGLGYKKVVRFLMQRVCTHPEQVGMAIYFLPNMKQVSSTNERELICNLIEYFCSHVSQLDIKSAYLNACLQYNKKNN